MRQNSRALSIVAIAASAMTWTASAVAQGSLTVYCSILEEQCRKATAEFEHATGIKVAMVRKSAGETYDQIKAEAANPKADVWWGGPGDPHLQAGEENLLEAYTSPNLTATHDWAQRLHQQSGGRSTGIYLGTLGFGYNTEVLKKKGLAEPKCWTDLLDPKFKDEVQVSDPNSSGTAYVMLASIVQLMGEDQGFDYLKKLHVNVNQYTKSGVAPVKALSTGETGVAIAFLHDMVTQIVAGAPIMIAAPCEGTDYETGAVSLVKGARNATEAKKFLDWILTAEAQKSAFTDLKVYSIPSAKAAEPHPSAPKLVEMKLIAYDSAKYGSSTERSRLLKKWDTDVKALRR